MSPLHVFPETTQSNPMESHRTTTQWRPTLNSKSCNLSTWNEDIGFSHPEEVILIVTSKYTQFIRELSKCLPAIERVSLENPE